jgi:hypothetical protein
MFSPRLFVAIYVVLGFMLSTDAFAFYYEEHKHISQKALKLAISNKLLIIPVDLRQKFGTEHLCDDLLDDAPGDCFTLSDLPSLAGDHAGSPVLLKWKWLSKGLTPKTASVIDLISPVRILKEFNCISSETTISKPPQIKKFAEAVHGCSLKKLASNYELTIYDPNFLNTTAHNCNHFRQAGVSDKEELMILSQQSYVYNTSTKRNLFKRLLSLNFGLINPRVREKPEFYASAWYAQLHAAALELAAEQGEYNLAAAWLFETFALHFLQDGIASGHINTPSEGGINVLTETKIEHDDKSDKGLEVSISNACIEFNLSKDDNIISFPNLAKACSSTSQTVRIYGDKNLVDSPITKELAVYLTYVSLTEFSEAIQNQSPKLSLPVIDNEYKSDPAWISSDQESEQLYKLLFTWWESAGSKKANSLMKQAAMKYLEDGKIKALTLWPLEKDKLQISTTEIN